MAQGVVDCVAPQEEPASRDFFVSGIQEAAYQVRK
jgi:hypothetical protein